MKVLRCVCVENATECQLARVLRRHLSLQVLHGGTGVTSERMKFLSAEINHLVVDLEQLGAMGRVEEAQTLMKKVEGLERERERERLAVSSKV